MFSTTFANLAFCWTSTQNEVHISILQVKMTLWMSDKGVGVVFSTIMKALQDFIIMHLIFFVTEENETNEAT